MTGSARARARARATRRWGLVIGGAVVVGATVAVAVVVGSGLSFYLGAVPVMTLNAANTLLFGFSVAAAGMFAHSFIERDRLHPRLRRALPLAAAWALLASGVHAFFPFALRPVQSALYYWAYIPVLFVYVWMLVDALGRGSVAARYQTIGWALKGLSGG